MDKKLLIKHIKHFIADMKKDPERFNKDYQERLELVDYYKSHVREKIINMTQEDIYYYISKLWAMRIWGNKHYVVDKIIGENGLDNFKYHLDELVRGDKDISVRWDIFRKEIKGMGPAMMSEILCKTYPDNYMLWNRRAYVALNYLGVEGLPRYDYQFTGKMYRYLCGIAKQISDELVKTGFHDGSLLAVDYLIWDELQVVENLGDIYEKKPVIVSKPSIEESAFIHNDIRDKLSDIGQWLGFTSRTEQKVAEGSKIDTIWEATIGNMGRVIYVFEVQTKGSIDSLIINLLQSLNNPAVQGVVAVSDKQQIETIKKRAVSVKGLSDKLKYWDYESVLKVHENLEFVNSTINELDLVPESF